MGTTRSARRESGRSVEARGGRRATRRRWRERARGGDRFESSSRDGWMADRPIDRGRTPRTVCSARAGAPCTCSLARSRRRSAASTPRALWTRRPSPRRRPRPRPCAACPSRSIARAQNWKHLEARAVLCPVTFFPAVRRRRSDWKGRGAHSSRRRRTRARFTYAHDRVYIMFGSITKPAYDAFYANFMKVRRARDLEASDRRRSDR